MFFLQVKDGTTIAVTANTLQAKTSAAHHSKEAHANGNFTVSTF